MDFIYPFFNSCILFFYFTLLFYVRFNSILSPSSSFLSAKLTPSSLLNFYSSLLFHPLQNAELQNIEYYFKI